MLSSLFRCLVLLTVLGLPSMARATHIVGAELTYTCLNPSTNTYQVQLRMLRDCLLGEAPFDEQVYLFAFSTANPGNYRYFILPKPPVTPEIIPTQWGQCMGTPYDLCVEEGIYRATITIPPITGGWDFAWARCCRNANIDNLFNPLNQGVTFMAHMPGPETATCNSMPTFNSLLPTFVCVGEDFYFDHSATDPDGDSLVYRLTRPYGGVNVLGQGAGNPAVGGPPPVVDLQNLMGPPPYAFVSYSGPQYTATGPFGTGSASINPSSGWLHFNPPQVGVYVVAVSVFEYRNGILLSENKKDLQLHVLQCLPQNDPPQINHVFSPTDSVVGDTVVIEAVDTACYRVTVSDPNNNSLGIQPISAIFSGSSQPTLSISGNNPLFVDVCWNSDCAFAGTTIQLILMGYDETNCPIYNPAFDTVYIKIVPPTNGRPSVGHQMPPNNPLGPDTIQIEVDSSECFVMWVADTLGFNGQESFQVTVEDVLGGAGPSVSAVPNLSDPDSIPISICWTAGCANRGGLYRVILEGTLEASCPPYNNRFDTAYIYVPGLPNPPPTVTPSLTGLVVVGDTIYADVHDTVCFTFSVNDTFPGLDLTPSVSLEPANAQTVASTQPTVQILEDGDSLVLQVCWYPVCANVDGLYRLVLAGTQENRCGEFASTRDTVHLRVRDVVNPPPVIAHQFLPGYVFNGDTLLITPDSLGCFGFSLRDSGQNTFLEMDFEVILLSTLSPSGHVVDVTVSTQTDTLLEGTGCFLPGCAYLGELLLVRLTGRDTFDCNPSNWVHDSLYVRVLEPTNNPPAIRHILDGLPVQGNTAVVVPQAEPFCYVVELDDPDSLHAALTAEGVSTIFEDWFRYGNPAEVSVSGTNPLVISVCWRPSCYDSQHSFDLVVCGRDTSRCGTTPTVCDTVRFRVEDCGIEVQNVFSPNGDGINDQFLPYHAAGVEYYKLNIFDRWGREVYQAESAPWDGTKGGNGNAVPDGVYYYIFEYKLFSARGVPLQERSAGWVTLVR